jgi:hypothetical protein
MIQEANPFRTIMALDLAEPALGSLYDLYVDALGATAAWWLGHITIIATISFLYWVITNWSEVSYGLGITGTRVSAWLALITLIGAQIILYQDFFGFPTIGAILTSIGTSLYIWWQWYQLEPQKA